MATTALAAGVAPGIISEKTVELNLSIEIANFLYSRHGRPAFAWGPTLRQEARWGFDAAYGINGRFIYVQFKRAHDEAPGHRFELNRTAARDQHRKLQLLEASGVAVRYGLPRFRRCCTSRTTVEVSSCRAHRLDTPVSDCHAQRGRRTS